MTRLEELHKAYEDSLVHKELDWVFVYNQHPPDKRIVDLWILDADVNKFGYQGRFDHRNSVWMSVGYSYRNWNVVAWKDI